MNHAAENLSNVLHQTRLNSLLIDAHVIRAWPNEEERNAEAARMVRMVKTRLVLQEITEQQYQTVLRLLSFVETKSPEPGPSTFNEQQAACDAFGSSDCCGD